MAGNMARKMATPSYDSTDGAYYSTFEYTWYIKNSRMFKMDLPLYSSLFETEADVGWQAMLWRHENGATKCGLKYLGCLVLGPYFSTTVQLRCFLKGSPDKELFFTALCIFDSIVNEQLQDTSNELSLNNVTSLTLIYKLTTRNRDVFTIPRNRLLQDVPKTCQALTAVDFKFSDAVDSSLKGHKEILASRSSVFAAMFNNNMAEKQHNSVTITDISQETFEQLLKYIYTDKAQHSPTTVAELLAAADKYDLARLKAACERALFRCVSVSTGAETLILADKHSAPQLKSHMMEFIRTNAHAVLSDNQWKTLVNGHPQLLLEMYQAMAKK